MEMNTQAYIPAALFPRNEPKVPNEYQAKTSMDILGDRKTLTPCQKLNTHHSAERPGIKLTELSKLYLYV
jgi:hypothetical protein